MKSKINFVFNAVLHSLSCLLAGMIAASIWVTHSDLWKMYLPAFCIAITLKNAINETEK